MNPATFAAAAIVLLAVSAYGESCERNGVKCPDYTVVETHQDYEERDYPSLVWVTTSANGTEKSRISRRSIKLLYAYLGGANEKGEKFQMTVPVRTKKVAHEGYNTYTMAIGLRPSGDEMPPAAVNPEVTVVREPKTTYVVRSFGGFAREDSIWDDQAGKLADATLFVDGVDSSFYYMNVYDSPWRKTNRLNEVWMVKAAN